MATSGLLTPRTVLAAPAHADPAAPIWRILERARWAPSGDNTQVWRFRILGEREAEIHGRDTRDHVVYDRDGHASQIALGALLETVRIAASAEGLRAELRRIGDDDRHPAFALRLAEDADACPDVLAQAIERRCTSRRAYSTRALTPGERWILAQEAGIAGMELRLFEGVRWRWRWARLMWANAGVRLTCQEAWQVHREVLDFTDPLSRDRVPAASVGADPVMRAVMGWAMADWTRLRRLNRWAAGTVLPRLEMDLLPGLACAAHLAVVAPRTPEGLEDHLAVGRAVQRVWLRATMLGLQFQPEHTPLCFAGYVRSGRRFTADPQVWKAATACTGRLDAIAGPDAVRFGFLARIGHGRTPDSRSTRLGLGQLLA